MKRITIALLMASGAVSAQTAAQERIDNANRAASGLSPTYRVSVTEGTTKAISYRNRSGFTKIDFRGTPLMPDARGEAKVESRKGYTKIDVEFHDIGEATQFGAEYLTYVLWAISPEGRTSNLGEILRNGTNGKLEVTTELQAFGLVVTAEPYFAVSRPSDVIVMENEIRPDTSGKGEVIDAKYELLQRGQYEHLAKVLDLHVSRKMPLELYEARNAVQIARSSGADRYATETFLKAENDLAQAEAYHKRNAGLKPITMTARQAVETAEDARAIAVKRQDEDLAASDRQAAAERESRAENATAAAQSNADRATREAADERTSAREEVDRLKRENDAKLVAAQTEADRLRLENESKLASAQTNLASAQTDAERLKRENETQNAAAQTEADRLRLENESKLASAQTDAERLKRENETQNAAAQTEADRLRLENESKLASAQTDADRLKRENEAQTAASQTEADRLKRENEAQTAASQTEADRLKRQNEAQTAASQTEADRLKEANDAQRVSAQTDLDRVEREKQRLVTEKSDLRAQLLLQFNTILQTRDTARGLIVNMSDVLFDTAKYSLRPEAREKLARVAGIVEGHPGLRLAVEGNTDSVGNDDYNQQLSEQRGESVRDYLISQGMAGTSVTSRGFGKTQPVASNDTASGRQQNRRVELVISGEIIGTVIGTPIAAIR